LRTEPLPPQRIEPERTDAIDLGRDRGRLSPVPPHDQALGWAKNDLDVKEIVNLWAGGSAAVKSMPST
jgi:hypothetical protein